MKHTVSDESVHEFTERIRNGLPSGETFPGKMSDCDFTEAQREEIRKARAERKAQIKESKKTNPTTISEQPSQQTNGPVPAIPNPKARPLTKLRKMLYLQSNCCFFCGRILREEEASIEHLQPLSKGGRRTEDNEVVCHKSLNETFGHMDLKHKIVFILRQAGNFTCPQTIE